MWKFAPQLQILCRFSGNAVEIENGRPAVACLMIAAKHVGAQCIPAGRYFAMTFALKKVSRKRSQLEGAEFIARRRLVPLNLSDEGAGALVRRRLENPGRRPLFDDAALVH